MRAWIAIVALALAGCAHKPDEWVRLDGAPASPEQLELATTHCRGETDRTDQRVGLYEAQEIFTSCMTRRGWKLQRD